MFAGAMKLEEKEGDLLCKPMNQLTNYNAV